MHRLVLVVLLACGSKDAPAPTVASGSGSGSAYEALGKKPANARRANPPPGIAAKALAVGAKAPAVELVDATGAPWTLASELGKHRVLIVFYRGDWCPHCRKQLGELHAKQADLANKDLGVVAISVDPPAAGKRLVDRLGLGFPVISDEKAASLKAFGIFDEENEIAWASIFVIGKDGAIVKRWLADTFSERVATDDVLADL